MNPVDLLIVTGAVLLFAVYIIAILLGPQKPSNEDEWPL